MVKIPLLNGYNVKKALTIQEPRVRLSTGKPVFSEKEISQIMKAFKENKQSYDAFRGQVHAQASSAGLRLNMRFLEDQPGKIAIDVADKSLVTNREFVDELSSAFDNPDEFFSHMKNAAKMLKNAFFSDRKGGVKTVVIDPKENYAEKVRGAVLDVIESREFAKR